MAVSFVSLAMGLVVVIDFGCEFLSFGYGGGGGGGGG